MTIYDIATATSDTRPEKMSGLGPVRGDIASFNALGRYGLYCHSLRQRRTLGFSTFVLATSETGVVYRQGEGPAGADLNGDGDLNDTILRHSTVSAAADLSFGLSAQAVESRFRNRIVIRTLELVEGVDANGDGDMNDFILFSADVVTGQVIQLGTVEPDTGSHPRIHIDGDLVYFRQGESSVGDLNGDGDVADRILVSVNSRTGALRSLGVEGAPLASAGRLVAFATTEEELGFDATGDGSLGDALLDVVDSSVGIPQGLALAIPLARQAEMNQRFLVDTSSESSQATASEPRAELDLNGDGDQQDRILIVHHLASGAVINTGLDRPFNFTIDRFGMTFTSLESANGVDRNGDGDTNDRTVFVTRR